jgi:hypothetical protein
MARDEAPIFERGKTYFDGATIAAADVTATNHLLGKEWAFEDLEYGSPPTLESRTGHRVVVRLVRNISGGALLPKRLVTLADPATSGYTVYGAEVDGYANVSAEHCYPVDEFLPAAGVADDDLFYIVVEGPAMVLSSLSGDANNVVTVGQALVAQTAVTSGATTSGRAIAIANLEAATNTITAINDWVNAQKNIIGRAMSAKTTGNTNADLLVMVGRAK